MTKKLLNQIHIYTPSTLIADGTIKANKIPNDDIDIDNFLHYPILLNNDNSLWKHGNLYILSKLKAFTKPSSKTLISIASDLRDFKQWSDDEDVDYLSAPRKILRPTYLYRAFLQEKLKSGKLSPNTVKRKMSAVVGFYKYLIDTEGMKFKYPLWESGITSITYKDTHGFMQAKQVDTTDITKVVSASNPDLYDDAIEDGGRLHPLEQEQQIALLKALKTLGNTEMTLAFLIALTTGARIQTVFTLRLKHFERVPTEDEKEIRLKIGYGTSCDTKYGKLHTLFVPIWLYNKIRIYINSPRAKIRRDKAKHIFETNDFQYLFLTNRGVPFYSAHDDPYRHLYSDAPNGGTVRQFILGSLKKQLKKDGFNFSFSFHDLRASFGMNLVDKNLPLIKKEEIDLTYLLVYVKERMGHSSLITTEKYLNFRSRHKLKEQAQSDFEKYMFGLIDE